jgi:hypothetical protein
MPNPSDLIDRELQVSDFVVFHNNIYEVKGVGRTNANGKGQVRIMLADPSPTTRPVTKYSGDLCKLDSADVLIWKLKKAY